MLTFLTQGFKANPGLKLANAFGVHISQSDLKMNQYVKKKGRQANLSPLFASLQRGLFVATASAPSRSSRSRSNVTCAYGGCWLWWCCTARNHPELNAIFLTEATIDNDDP